MRTQCFLLPAMAASVGAQFVNWTPDQINTTICRWEQPRAALIRDTIYLDGGNIGWIPGLADGRYDSVIDTGNLQGKVLTYNLSRPFDASTNVTGILLEDSLSKARGGEGNTDGAASNFYDGGMLANYAEFFLYGGAFNSYHDAPPDPDALLCYQAYEYGSDAPIWHRGWEDTTLGDGVTRYVAYGAAVNAPSENKAWYFSGLTAPGGEIIAAPQNKSDAPQNVSNHMVMVDMKEQGSEVWTKKSLQKDIKGRANPDAVWLPVGEQGIIVVLGGATYPYWASVYNMSPDKEASKEESPEFMQTIDIYDVASDEWYRQPTEDGPGTRTRGCAVVSHASDYSSYNIYYYGGNNGIDPTSDFYDEVWVLSLPSFTWTKLNEGASRHGRAGHKCFTPYPDQMMVIGGTTALAGGGISCLDGGPVVMFNLTSGEWMDSYHPDKHGDYGVPEKVRDAIGGDASGGATATTPVPSGWATKALGAVFATSYDMDKIKTWGPYKVAETETGRPELPGGSDDGGGGLPSWVAPVLGVVLGLMLVTGAIVLFCLWRRRKIFKNRSSDYGTEDAGNRILSWIRGQPTEKAPTVTTSEDAPLSPEMGEARAVGVSSPSSQPTQHHEMAGTPIAELDDTSPPAELSDTGLTPVDIIQKHSRLASDKTRSMSHQSYSSFSGGPSDYNSNVSRSSIASNSNAPDADARTDSPSVPNVPDAGQGHGQMQSLSETLAGANDGQTTPGRRVSDQMNPVSPPTAGDSPRENYVSAPAPATTVSPLRQSVFHEHKEDMEKKD